MRQVVCLLALLPASVYAVLTVTIQHNDATCWYSDGGAIAIPSGGVPPYAYAWSNGVSDQQIQWVPAGTYSVTVTDANSEEVTEQVTIQSVPYNFQNGQGYAYCGQGGELFPNWLELPSESAFPWSVNGIQLELSPGSPTTYVYYPGSSNYTLPISDGNGCTGTISGYLGPQITFWPTLSVLNIEPSCSNQNIGAITVQSAGVQPEPFWTWVNLVNASGISMGQAYNIDPLTLQVEFTGLAPGTYGVHWWLGQTLELIDPGICDHDTVWVTVPSLGPVCGVVSGRSWFDVDGDCMLDANEVGVPYSPLMIQPGSEMLLTGSDGRFSLPLLNGSYTLEQIDPTLVPVCPLPQPIPFTVNSNVATIDLGNGSTLALDMRASVTSGAARPGFAHSVHASATNASPQLSGPVTYSATIDPLLTITSITPTPTTSNGNLLTWELPAFNSYQVTSFHIVTEVPVGTPLGTLLNYSVAVSNTLADNNPANDMASYQREVTGSFDPNDKVARTSTGANNDLYFIDQDQWIDYTIRFQNTGTDTAFTVVVTDTLPADLDIASFEMGTASHPFVASFRTGRVVEWRFPNILLPDSNVNEAGSHGLLSFRIKPVLPLLPGSEIANIANIYFDFNEPVITDPSVLVAEFSTDVAEERSGAISIFPNPASEHIIIQGGKVDRIRLIGTDGRVLCDEHPVEMPFYLDARQLATGPYLIEVLNNEGMRYTNIIVKN